VRCTWAGAVEHRGTFAVLDVPRSNASRAAVAPWREGNFRRRGASDRPFPGHVDRRCRPLRGEASARGVAEVDTLRIHGAQKRKGVSRY
jgi:hypothetical protein